VAPAFSHVLLAYDDSPGSRIALEYACALTRGDAKLTVAHAVDELSLVASTMTASGFAAVDPTPLIAAVDEAGAAILQSAVDACATRGVKADQVFIHDAAHVGILELERSRDVDLIVLGTHGRQGIPRAVLGSVAEGILRASNVPVLIVTGSARMPRRDQLFERALVALDDSAPARAAMTVAARVATELAMNLTLCHVIDSRELLAKATTYGYDPNPVERNLHAAALRLLEDAKADGSAAPLVDELVVVEGPPAEQIEHTALQHNCDLIVLGSHVRRGFDRLLFGSVAEGVLRRSVLPVLVVPTRKRAASEAKR
jgi:nucleotide-binding universal stress UspA family protein